MKNRMLSDFRYHKRHEYSELLADVYRFGVNASEDAETTIGNVMRRTLEAFRHLFTRKVSMKSLLAAKYWGLLEMNNTLNISVI